MDQACAADLATQKMVDFYAGGNGIERSVNLRIHFGFLPCCPKGWRVYASIWAETHQMRSVTVRYNYADFAGPPEEDLVECWLFALAQTNRACAATARALRRGTGVIVGDDSPSCVRL